MYEASYTSDREFRRASTEIIMAKNCMRYRSENAALSQHEQFAIFYQDNMVKEWPGLGRQPSF